MAIVIVDCDGCRARGPACQDCVVTVLLGSTPDADVAREASARTSTPVLVAGATLAVRGSGRVELDAAEQAAIAVLAGSGLVPPLRVVPGTGARGTAAVHGPDDQPSRGRRPGARRGGGDRPPRASAV